MNKVLLANIAAAVSSLSAGVAIVATRFVITETDAISLAFYRYLIGAICVAPFLVAGLRKQKLTVNHIFPIIILGIILYALFPLGFSESLNYTSAAYGAIALATLPIFTLLLACLLKHEQLTKSKIFSVILAFIGVTIAVSDSQVDTVLNRNDLYGISLMLACALLAAIYSVYSKPLLSFYNPIYFTAMSITLGMLALLPLASANGTLNTFPNFTQTGWLAVIFLGAIGGALQFSAYTWALKWLTPTRVVIYLTLNPISAIFLANLLLGEPITINIIIGLLFVLISIFLVNIIRNIDT